VICLPEAIGTTDFLATRLDKYWILAWSLASIWSTLSSHESGFEGLNGEHGLYTWNTCRFEPWSGVSHLGFCPWAKDTKRRRAMANREKGLTVTAMASCELE
jgi:hypothetical protein